MRHFTDPSHNGAATAAAAAVTRGSRTGDLGRYAAGAPVPAAATLSPHETAYSQSSCCVKLLLGKGREVGGRIMSPNHFNSSEELPAFITPRDDAAAATTQDCWPLNVSPLPAAALPLLRPLLLISDLDDTLIGGEPQRCDESWKETEGAGGANVWGLNGALEEADTRAVMTAAGDGRSRSRALKAAFSQWRHVSSAASGPPFRLINTGRTLPLFLAAVAERGEEVPEPDVLVCGVGTRIYIREPAGGPMGSPTGWREEVRWSQRASAGWNIREVTEALREAMQQMGPDSVCWRDARENDDLKVTVCVSLEALPDLVGLLDLRLRLARVCYRTVIGPTDEPPGWAYMDILPAGAGKNAAAHYVRQMLGFDPWDTVVSGDAPNDLDMLAGAQHHAIAVSNCHPSLRAFALALDSRREQHQRQGEGKREGQGPAWRGLARADDEAVLPLPGEGSRECPLKEIPGNSGDVRYEDGSARNGAGKTVGGCSGAAVAAELGPVMRHVGDVLLRLRDAELRGSAADGEGGQVRGRQDAKSRTDAEKEEGRGEEGDGVAGGPGSRSDARVAAARKAEADGVEVAAAALLAAATGGSCCAPAPPSPPSLRVHLASLPAAGGVMEGLRVFGFI